MKHLILKCLKVLFFFLIFNACQSNSNDSSVDCSQGEPTPVFSLDSDFVKSHQFSKEQQRSTENILFTDSLKLTIRQSGCEKVRQEYEFVLAGSRGIESDSIWVERSAELFSHLGRYEEKFYSFNQWANKINQHKSEIKLTEAFEVAPNVYIQIDRIRDPQAALLQVVLFEK